MTTLRSGERREAFIFLPPDPVAPTGTGIYVDAALSNVAINNMFLTVTALLYMRYLEIHVSVTLLLLLDLINVVLLEINYVFLLY